VLAVLEIQTGLTLYLVQYLLLAVDPGVMAFLLEPLMTEHLAVLAAVAALVQLHLEAKELLIKEIKVELARLILQAVLAAALELLRPLYTPHKVVLELHLLLVEQLLFMPVVAQVLLMAAQRESAV
jgi:hypothetical protein